MKKAELFIALRYLKLTGKGVLSYLSFFSILGVFLGVAALVIVIGVMSGMHQELKKRILGINPHVIITNYYGNPVEQPDSIIEILKKYPEVKSANPYIMAKCVVKRGERADGVVLKGLDFKKDPRLKELQKSVVTGKFELGRNKVVLGTLLASDMNAFPGDTVTILTFKGKTTNILSGIRARNMEVTGVVDFGIYDFNTSVVLTDLAGAQNVSGITSGVSGIEVELKNPYKAAEFAKKISKILPIDYRIVTWIEMNRSLFSALKLEKLAMFVILILIIVVASFSIVAMLMLLVVQKTRDIGILRALGVTSRGIKRIFMMVGGFVGLFGAVGGGIFGVIVNFLIGKYRLISLPPDVYFVDHLPVQTRFSDVVTIIVATFLIIFIATLYPAHRAASLSPQEAIRNE